MVRPRQPDAGGVSQTLCTSNTFTRRLTVTQAHTALQIPAVDAHNIADVQWQHKSTHWNHEGLAGKEVVQLRELLHRPFDAVPQAELRRRPRPGITALIRDV